MRTDLVGRLSVVAAPLVLAGCALFGLGSAERDLSTTCADWRAMSAEARLRLADRLVGGSPDVLERIRIAQHEAAGTSRDLLVREVEGSFTKNCDVMAPGNPLLFTLFNQLYLD